MQDAYAGPACDPKCTQGAAASARGQHLAEALPRRRSAPVRLLVQAAHAVPWARGAGIGRQAQLGGSRLAAMCGRACRCHVMPDACCVLLPW